MNKKVLYPKAVKMENYRGLEADDDSGTLPKESSAERIWIFVTIFLFLVGLILLQVTSAQV